MPIVYSFIVAIVERTVWFAPSICHTKKVFRRRVFFYAHSFRASRHGTYVCCLPLHRCLLLFQQNEQICVIVCPVYPQLPSILCHFYAQFKGTTLCLQMSTSFGCVNVPIKHSFRSISFIQNISLCAAYKLWTSCRLLKEKNKLKVSQKRSSWRSPL